MSFGIRKTNTQSNSRIVKQQKLSENQVSEIIKQKTKKLAELHLNNPINKINIPILYINLDTSLERNRYIQAQIDFYNLQNITRISGIDGRKKLNDNIKEGNIDGIEYKNYSGNKFTELGCLLSHIKAIKHAYDNNYNETLIVEDDCYFGLMPCWEKDSLKHILSELPSDWEIVALYHNRKIETDKKYTLIKNNYGFGTVAYAINRRGMEKILNNTGCDIIDFKNNDLVVSDSYIYHLVNTYIYNLSLFIPINISLKSTVGNGELCHLNWSKNILDKYV
jgi:GR25 family glycosyltransferase involved in LPS biosynthesis